MRALCLAVCLLLAALPAFAQPVLDSHKPTNTVVGGTTVTVSMSTDGANEIVQLLVVGGVTAATTVSVAGCGLTWTRDADLSLPQYPAGIYRALAVAQLSACTITATFNATLGGNGAAIGAWAWEGATIAAPLDGAVSGPPTPGGSEGACTLKMGGTYTTTLAHDVIVMVQVSQISIGASTPCGSETKILGVNEDGDVAIYAQYQAFTTTVTSQKSIANATSSQGVLMAVTAGGTGRARLIQ